MKNIVLVTVDCLRFDRCGFTGHHRDTTPALDNLATTSQVYDAAYAPGMRTNESVPGILSGRLSAETSYLDEIHLKCIPKGSETLATWLGEMGYETTAVITNPQLSSARNFDIGFDKFSNLEATAASQLAANQPGNDNAGALFGQLLGNFSSMLESAERFPINPFIASYVAYRESQRRSEWPTVAASAVVDSFADAIDSADGPFFGWTHFMDLHAPIHPDRVLEGGLVDAPVAKQFVWDAHRVVGREEPNYDRMYDSVLRYVDAQIGRLVELLRQRGLWDDTVLIVTSDHGEALYDRGVHGHGEGTGEFDHVDDVLRHYLYDELLHVPLLIRTPEGGAERINEPVSLCGLGELIAEIVDASAPDLSARNGRPVVADALTEDGHTIAVRSEDWKLITPCVADDAAPETWSNELFRVASDRGERAPIDEPHIESQLAEAAAEIVTDPSDLPQMRGTVSEDTREQLAELGYR